MMLFSKIKAHFDKQLPFVAYCKPGSDTAVAVFQQDDALHRLTDFTENGFVFVSFDGNDKFLIPSANADVHVEKMSSAFYISGSHHPNTDEAGKSSFESLVEKGIRAIENGDFQKVVLSRTEHFDTKGLDIEMVFNSLYSNYPTAFKYCFFHPKIGFWIGATPEQFLKIEGNELKTVALAGTQLFSESVSWEVKEKDEQQYVTDFIASSLENYCHTISISEPYTTRAGNLAHIKTDIAAELNDKEELGKLIGLLHPTPAVCGLPKESAKQFILQHEKYDRKLYAGFLGELNMDFRTFKTDNSDLYVNLRCMEMEGDKASVYVGCGITKDSIPEKEYIETVNKSMTIRKVVNL